MKIASPHQDHRLRSFDQRRERCESVRIRLSSVVSQLPSRTGRKVKLTFSRALDICLLFKTSLIIDNDDNDGICLGCDTSVVAVAIRTGSRARGLDGRYGVVHSDSLPDDCIGAHLLRHCSITLLEKQSAIRRLVQLSIVKQCWRTFSTILYWEYPYT
jgi:hypothetical protein